MLDIQNEILSRTSILGRICWKLAMCESLSDFEKSQDLIKLTVSEDNINLLKNIHSKIEVKPELYNLAIQSQSLLCLKYLHEQGYRGDSRTGYYAAKTQNPEIFNLVICVRNILTMNGVARYKSFKDFYKLHQNGFFFNSSTANYAAKAGNIEILKYIKKFTEFNRNICEYAVKHGKLECLKYLIDNDYMINEECFSLAMKYDRLECFKFLFEEYSMIISSSSIKESITDNFVCIRYLHENDKLYDNEMYVYYAVLNNNLKCLKFLLENGYSPSTPAYYPAIAKKNLEMIKLLYDYNCATFDECYTSVYYGSLECLQFFHEHNFPWDESVSKIAFESKNRSCLNFLKKHNCPDAENYHL